jgi:pyruvate,orthophosphate dikinase
MRNLLGGKGANLAEMSGLGLPVPQGFTITTEACTQYYDDGRKINDSIQKEILDYVGKIEALNGKKFGDKTNPLLVSVRSGARASMPGMMDTILNLGLNEDITELLAKQSGNARWAWDCYRRFVQMYSDVVMELGKETFGKLLDAKKKQKGVELDVDLTADDLKELTNQYKAEYKSKIGEAFPDAPIDQLFGAVKAVFRSWDNPRANTYRRENGIPYSWGTAVNVQPMVFGNLNDDSGTGVAFTRNASTGEKALDGEFLINAQGEDVVAGIRTPHKIAKLAEIMPDAYKQFIDICDKLEDHYRDMQDMEFTIENKKLFMLQTRNGKRSAVAALKIACDLVDEGRIDDKKAVTLIDPKQLDELLHPCFDKKALDDAKPIGKAIDGSPGAAVGQVVFTADEAVKLGKRGEGKNVVLVRLETSPEDIEGMIAAQGILTVRGGRSSHAAVVARGMGTPAVVGCTEIDYHGEDDGEKYFVLGGQKIKQGDYISLNGSTGKIYAGAIKTFEPNIEDDANYVRIIKWADKYRRLKVRTNADTPRDALKAAEFGAEGIGLCRTEHMFFEDRIAAFREMILADDKAGREKALDKIEPLQQSDFEKLYEALKGYPVVIRFLDPPLHEFVPTDPEDIKALAKDTGVTVEHVNAVITSLHEFNPMMGHRGCRLAVTYPEIAAMQTRAVIKAAVAVNKKGIKVVPEIMIPLVGDVKELAYVKKTVVETADATLKALKSDIKYSIGTMIEIPRAALTADEIAKEAEFFSFGTNDLTQMTFGFSRDDAGKFLPSYYEAKIYENDPFQTIDQNGVGQLVKLAVEKGKAVKGDKIHFGICGEHGGDPATVEFCHKVGLDYVSCSPYRVPIARLAAAQAAINNG